MITKCSFAAVSQSAPSIGAADAVRWGAGPARSVPVAGTSWAAARVQVRLSGRAQVRLDGQGLGPGVQRTLQTLDLRGVPTVVGAPRSDREPAKSDIPKADAGRQAPGPTQFAFPPFTKTLAARRGGQGTGADSRNVRSRPACVVHDVMRY
jgi:hypothetical protein